MVDAHNLLTQYKRPFALQAQSIGVWENWLLLIAHLGVLMNAATIAFSSPYFESNYLNYFTDDTGKWFGRLLFIFVFEHSVIFIQLLVTWYLTNTPRQVKEAIARQDYIERVLRGEKEDEIDILSFDLSSVCCS